MADPKPQQRLFLELIRMSGDIAVTETRTDTVLHRTLEECRDAGWIAVTPLGGGTIKVASLTATGRRLLG